MICPKCANDMIETRATEFGEDYWYCRTCKKEAAELIVLELPPEEQTILIDYDTIYDSAVNKPMDCIGNNHYFNGFGTMCVCKAKALVFTGSS